MKIKNIFALLLAMLMCLSTWAIVPAIAETTIINYNEYTVEYNVVSEWDGYQNISIVVTNTSN